MPASVVQDWVSATTGSAASPTNVSVTLSGTGTPATAGNTILVAVNSDNTVTTPSGYTLIASSIHNAGCYLYGKIAAGGETGVTVTPSGPSSTSVAIAEIGNLSGATIANQVDAVITNGSSSGAFTRSTGTTAGTVQADEYAVAVWGYSANVNVGADFATGGNNKWSGQTNSFVEKLDVGTTKSSGTNAGLCIAVKDLNSTGTVESTATVINSNSIPSESMMATFKVAAGSTPKSIADTASSAEALTATAAAALADTASTAESLSATVTTALADAASAADSASVGAAVPLTQTASAADSLTVTVSVGLADAGSATDAPAETATVPLADTASASDTLDNGLGTVKSLTDTASAAEALGVAVTVPLADTGSAVDTRAISAAVPLADAGSASDAVDNGTGTAKPIGDTGTATETLTVTASVALTDVAAGAQALTASAALALADAAAAVDAYAASAAIALADTGAGAQTLVVGASLALTDTGAATDTATGQDNANVSKFLTDTGSATDQLSFVHGLIVGAPGVTGDSATASASGDALGAEVTGDGARPTIT